MVAMTGKNLNQKNKFVIQLTSNYRIQIDRLNCTLMKKCVKDEIEDLLEDEEIEDNYRAIGYFSSVNPEHLVKNLIVDSILGSASPKVLKLNEFISIFNECTVDLTKKIGKVTKIGDGLTQTIEAQKEEINSLLNENRILKGTVTKLKGKH